MGHTLKNKDLELQIDFPLENYNFTRFDWTGKITSLKFKNIPITGIEDFNCSKDNYCGKGFYNEFGIDTALGFDETEIGGWFHKIGIGALKKEDSTYEFHKKYALKPAKFETKVEENNIEINCISDFINGYSYELRKIIELHDNGFTIKYQLKNTGEKTIHTNEYAHNFLAIANDLISENYSLKFPFDLKPDFFEETVNLESVVDIQKNSFTFNSTPNEQFFFSNLSGGEQVTSGWELRHLTSKIGVREHTSFQTNKINLWGWQHVISPELFFDINVAPRESTEWIRSYELFTF